MERYEWFVFDIGNVILKLAYERVIENICRNARSDRTALIDLMEQPGGYRDLERGAVDFGEFHEFLRDRAGYRGRAVDLRLIWSDFFEGPVEGIEQVLDRVRRQYRVAYLSNSNEVHADLIPRRYAALFAPGEPLIFSHMHKCSKPDAVLFLKALEILGTTADRLLYVDDLQENVFAARDLGIRAFHFTSAAALLSELELAGLLPDQPPRARRS